MISPYKIRWNGYSSVTIPVDITTRLSFDGDSGDVETYLSREAVVSETYNGALKRGNSYKWSESMSPTITIIKKDFSDFTRDENRKILSWLTSKQTSGFLDIYTDDSEAIEYSVLGNFISVSQYKLGNSRVVGYVAQFEALMPWALSPLHILPNTFDPTNIDITKMKDVSAPASNTFTITIDTDEPQTAVYPRITIKHNGQNYVRVADTKTFTATSSDMIPGTVYYNGTTYYWRTLNATKKTGTTRPNYEGWTVHQVDHAYGNSDTWETGYIYQYGTTYYWLEPANTFYSNSANPNLNTTSVKVTNAYTIDGAPRVATCRIANNTLDETIILDGANKVISSSRTSRIFGNEFIDWEWLPLYDGINTITVEGNCSVAFEYREVRKVGEY